MMAGTLDNLIDQLLTTLGADLYTGRQDILKIVEDGSLFGLGFDFNKKVVGYIKYRRENSYTKVSKPDKQLRELAKKLIEATYLNYGVKAAHIRLEVYDSNRNLIYTDVLQIGLIELTPNFDRELYKSDIEKIKFNINTLPKEQRSSVIHFKEYPNRVRIIYTPEIEKWSRLVDNLAKLLPEGKAIPEVPEGPAVNESEELEVEVDGQEQHEKSEEAQEASQESDELEVELEAKPSQDVAVSSIAVQQHPRLVQLYLLAFELPSFALAKLATEIKADLSQGILTEINKFDAEIRRKIESERRAFYSACDRLFEVAGIGWVTVSDEGIKFAQGWNNRFKNALEHFAKLAEKKATQTTDPNIKELYQTLATKLRNRASRLIVKCYKIYMDIDEARELLKDIVS